MPRTLVGDFSGLIDLWEKRLNELIPRYNRQNRPGIANSLVATASPYGVGEAVLEAGRAEEVDTAPGKSP
jgi:hypothetical protein